MKPTAKTQSNFDLNTLMRMLVEQQNLQQQNDAKPKQDGHHKRSNNTQMHPMRSDIHSRYDTNNMTFSQAQQPEYANLSEF